MRQHSFILLVHPYLLRKGLSSILGHMPGVRVIREMDSSPGLDKELKANPSACLVIGEELLKECEELFLQHPGLWERSLVLRPASSPLPEKTSQLQISEGAGKEEIMRCLRELMDADKGQLDKAEDELTPREQTIVKLVSLGMTNKKIAEKLFLSTHTVITHRKNISSKLGIKSASGLTVYAIVNNLVTIEEASAKAGE